MFTFETIDFSVWQWLLAGLAAVMIGVSKTGIPGLSILVVPLMASVMPAKMSVGVVLPMLIFADIFAISYYRRHAEWKHILRLLPLTLVGILVGFFAMGLISDSQLKPIIGVIVLIMLAARLYHQQTGAGNVEEGAAPKHHPLITPTLGLFAGITTMMANAAGPVMTIYLLLMRVGKIRFVGTCAWFFFIVNWIKVPLSVKSDLITAESLKISVCLMPLILIGVVTGILVLKKIPQKAFNIVVQLLATAAAIKLLF